MLTMILQMTGATAIYTIATIVIWAFWHKKPSHSLPQRVAVGLFYGLCSIASNHIGIDYGHWVLNVRDLGPLAAGLFFDPLSGILAGVIGGAERFIIGEFFGIGSFTRVACGLSTVLAGFLAAALHRWVYQGRRPSAAPCLFLGAEMEVFHMYAVLFTNRNELRRASEVVSECALPMIIFTALGLTACSMIIGLMSGMTWKAYLSKPKRETPIETRFQRWLLAVVLFVYASGLSIDYSLQTRMAEENTRQALKAQIGQYVAGFKGGSDLPVLKKELDSNNFISKSTFLLVDLEENIQYTCTGSLDGITRSDPQQETLIREHAGRETFRAALKQQMGKECMCIAARLAGPYYLLIGTPFTVVYSGLQTQMLEKLFLEILVSTALYLLVTVLVNQLVVRNLGKVNRSLQRITAGTLTETVDVEESAEFYKLSEDINTTVTALRGFIDAAEKRMEEDLKHAEAIQDAALPKNFNLPTDRIELYALMTPARQVGGDFYDFFYTAQDQLALVIADVSGKGIPGALFMMRAKTAIKNNARSGMSPARLLEAVNNILCEDNETGMFVTAWVGILELKTGRLCCANAGHEYPVLMRAGREYELLKDKHGPALGVFEDIPRKEYELQLQAGDRVFVYTDGVPEAINEREEQYGTARMTEGLNRLRELSQEETLKGVLEQVRQFAGTAEQFDDVTMLGFTYRCS